MRTKWEGEKAGVQDVWVCHWGEWVYETWTPTLCTTACCRIVGDATDAELRATGCWVYTKIMRYDAFY